MQPCPASMGKLVPLFHFTVAQALYVVGPLQPSLYRHQPWRAPSSSKVSANWPRS